MSGTNPFRRNTAQQSSYLPTTIASSHNASEREKERERERERENEREHGDRSEPRIPPIDTGENKLQGLRKKDQNLHASASSNC